jgi:type I restriction enzyme S subunit
MEVWKNPYIHKHLNFMEGSATSKEIERFGLRCGDVLLTKDSETKDEIAEPSLVREQIDSLVLGYHLAQLKQFPNIPKSSTLHVGCCPISSIPKAVPLADIRPNLRGWWLV